MLLIAKCTSVAVALGGHAMDATLARYVEDAAQPLRRDTALVRPYRYAGVIVAPRVHAAWRPRRGRMMHDSCVQMLVSTAVS